MDCVYVIAMPNRKLYMMEVMEKLGLPCIFANATTPKELTETDYTRLWTRKDKKTWLAVHLSHMKCYHHAIKNNYKTVLVFEDDIKVNASLDQIVNSVEEFKISDFQAFYAGYCYLDCKQDFDRGYRYFTRVPDGNILCSHATVFKVDFLKKFIKDLRYPISEAHDALIRDYFVKNGTKVCVPYSPFFMQNPELGTQNENYQNEQMLPYCTI
jgi:GR25 family glycosyltransferase involved in LPS biosynthesis